MNQQDIAYALAKQVPDMARGFTIRTNYGDIAIEAGWVASIVITHLERALRCELLELDGTAVPLSAPEAQALSDALMGAGRREKVMLASGLDQHGFSLEAKVIGAAYEQWATRKVDALLQVQFGGLTWSVQNMPSVHVGDLVQCRLSGQADVLFVSTGDPEHPTVCAQLVDSADQEESGLPSLPDAPLFGRGYVHRPVPAPVPAASCGPCGALACPRCGAELTHATGETA